MENMNKERVASRTVRCSGALPYSLITLRALGLSETKEEEAAVEIYENGTYAWRTQYKHPNLAVSAIGMEFVNQCQRSSAVMFTDSSVSQYSENGYSSIATPRGLRSSDADRLGISDMDNQYVPHIALITGKSLSRRCRI
ncbi:uncharacterized protein LOC121404407 isoform X2 [Drosophila obscura]|uniref:uncharacterized protein LOC121404407 isoform X2 n=1 Tax=Drosophila obscura TaxID=7282 RepID=UPI001BB154AC|nr:uncharacterized protein LOC121404407 isoform X2 [Drosophila obscura]